MALTLHSTLNGLPITITPPKYIRWLGFYLDRKLTFFDHVRILAVKGKAITTGLQCLGNTVCGLSPHHMHLLYRTCVIPVITYGCQLWYRPNAPKKALIKKLQIVQNKALRRITGAFRTSPTEALHLLSFIPPVEITLRKLCESAALRIFHLPLASEISLRLPVGFIPSLSSVPSVRIPPSHVPFPRPSLRSKKKKSSLSTTLTSHVASLDPFTERSDPYHSHNTPYAFAVTSLPFFGRLSIDDEPCAKSDTRSFVSEHNIFVSSLSSSPSSLVVYTDGSHNPQTGAGYSLIVFYRVLSSAEYILYTTRYSNLTW